MKAKPTIGITMGDPAGIGPEIVLKSLVSGNLDSFCRPVVIGETKVLKTKAGELDLDLEFVEVSKLKRFPPNETSILIYNLDNLNEDFPVGIESAIAGKASAEYIEAAIDLWKDGLIDAIATAPINKKSINMGGYDFPGHTEFLAELTDTKDFAMSFFADRLRVVLLSTHVSLRNAIELVTTDNLVEIVKFTHSELSKVLGRSVKLAVAGLNPHASEDGMFGDEEFDEIAPAIAKCRETLNIDVEGAFSPDTIFLRAFKGEFDAVIACYHDQATIAVKSLSFGESVNVTLGLPLIRTSVDHGTAFDIAKKNIADGSSMGVAIKLAAELVISRNSSAEAC